jgi:phosphoglycerate dehydrogenase-like enzyme
VVWICIKLQEEELRSLQRDFAEVEFRGGDDGGIEEPWLQKVEAVFTDKPLPDELVERMDKFRWLHVARGGAYPFLCDAIMQRPIQVTSSKGIFSNALSEFGLACIFALAKKLPTCWEAQGKRRLARPIPEKIAGKTLGIVGLGTVGSALARKAKGLGLRVIATKRTVEDKPPYVDEIGPAEYLSTLLQQADFVVVCLPHIPATERILGERELRSMKKSAYLINLTAGRAVEERLLVQALKEDWIAGAALNTLPREPLPEDSELWSLSNVMISPRVAGTTAEVRELIIPTFVENIKLFLTGEKMHNVVDKARGY